MAALVPGTARTLLYLGVQVSKAATVLPATTTANIFTVSGGRVVIVGFVGQCTTVCTSTATTVSVGLTPSTGTASDTGLATATAITSKEVGTLVSLPTAPGALLVGTNAGTAVVAGGPGYVVEPGSIYIKTSATNTGAFKWDLWYVPLDVGASVAST